MRFPISSKIFKDDPFAVLDQEGVGSLIRIAVHKGRSRRPELEVGICGGPSSVVFCVRVGDELRELLAVSGAHRAAGGGPGGAFDEQGRGHADGVIARA